MRTIDYIVLATIIILVIFVAIVFTIRTISKKNKIKLHENIQSLLTDLIGDQEARIERTQAYGFHYKIIEKNKITYVCIVYNPKCSEILINSNNKWQIKDNPMDESINFVDSVITPMMSSIEDEKEVKKLFIIYPNARQLMIAVNECEYAFVYPNTDVYGANVVTYKRLLNIKDIRKM